MNTENTKAMNLFTALLTLIVVLTALDADRWGIALLFGCWSAFHWIAWSIEMIRDIRYAIRSRKERRP